VAGLHQREFIYPKGFGKVGREKIREDVVLY
jgi:hypothetical protein